MGTVASLIYQTLEREDRARDRKPRGHYPSSAGFEYTSGRLIGPDILSQFHKWNGTPQSNPSDGMSLIKMRLGDGTHDQFAKVLAKAGVKALPEVPIKAVITGLKREMSGRCDELVEINGDLEVWEVKSSTKTAMFGFKPGAACVQRDGPKDDAKLQKICYLNTIPGVRRGRFVYICRDSGEMLEYVMERVPGKDAYTIDSKPEPELSWAGIVQRWAHLEALLEDGTPPPPEYKAWLNEKTGEVQDIKTIDGVPYKTPWRVMYDPYRDLIWKDPRNAKHSLNALLKADGLQAVKDYLRRIK